MSAGPGVTARRRRESEVNGQYPVYTGVKSSVVGPDTPKNREQGARAAEGWASEGCEISKGLGLQRVHFGAH